MTEHEKTVPVEVTEAAEIADLPADDGAGVPDGAIPADAPVARSGRRTDPARILAFGLLPALALVLALTAGYFKYVGTSTRDDDRAAVESVQAAEDGAAAILTYTSDGIEQQLRGAQSRLSPDFAVKYHDVFESTLIPKAKQRQISSSATVPAASSVSADSNHAVVLVFVNRTAVVGTEAPYQDSTSVRVTLDKIGGRWLISAFDPV